MSKNAPTVLATDLDGTLIPLEGNNQNNRDLQVIAERVGLGLELVFVTGRHFESVMQAIGQSRLPVPTWIICDVGTSIFRRADEAYQQVTAYQEYQAEITAPVPLAALKTRLKHLDQLRLQEKEKQGPFKLSYYVDSPVLERTDQTLQQIVHGNELPYDIIASVDPFNGDGLIDLLPKGVSKARAISWWADHVQQSHDSILFAGDSGNDFAPLTAGYRSILVGNADRKLAKRIEAEHRKNDWTDRLLLAQSPATSGVLEGLIYFEHQDS